MRCRSFLLLPLLLLCPLLLSAIEPPLPQAPEPPKTEIRAVWLTTIYGLDWPKRPARDDYEVKVQQQDLCLLLDSLQQANFNLVFLQVRLRGDVIYRSAIEPASPTFSGRTGQLPHYDPLAFAIEECHRRGMECHAWFVTFPVGTEKKVRDQGKLSVVKRRPELCKLHQGEWYLDPGVPETADYLVAMVDELVRNYNIDGIHFDYIRYPDRPKNFPDKQLYNKQGKKMKIDDWRRDNINRIVTKLYDRVKEIKPWVQVSSSPLGKYNRIEKVPNAGWTAYESVYQDPKQWMKEEKHDMVVPMMYYLNNNFFPFVDNWVENGNGRLVVPGLGAYRMEKSEEDWTVDDVTEQMYYSRANGAIGNAFFRCSHVLDDSKGFFNELKNTYYRYPAQLPPLTWLNDDIPPTPDEILVERSGEFLKLSWEKPEGCAEELTYTIYYSLSDPIDTSRAASILIAGIHATHCYLPINPEEEMLFNFQLTASSRYHIESAPSRETLYYLTNHPK